jgi:2-dehydropantoate 2-reductase
MRMAIVGAGSMGSVFGGHLALAGHDVVLVDVREDHVDAIRSQGLRMRRPGGEDSVVRLAATTQPADMAPVDVAIFLTKGFATREAAEAVRPAIRPDTWVLTVQNGLGNERVLGEVFDPAQVVPGTTTVGAMTDAPGVVTMSPGTAAGQSVTHLGPPRTGTQIPQGVVDVAKALTEAGLPTGALESADVVIWTKLAMAASMGPLTAILRRTLKDVWDDPASRGLWEDMFHEILAVARASGVPLDEAQVAAHARQTYESVGHHVTSMAADVVAGRRTEIETMALEVARRGEELGVPTPVTATVGRLVRSLEGSYERAL